MQERYREIRCFGEALTTEDAEAEVASALFSDMLFKNPTLRI
jgi:hypothetical protein